MTETAHRCTNCESTIQPEFKYCPECGQKTQVGRLTLSYWLQVLRKKVIDIDSDFLRLLLDLTRKPGHTIKAYLSGKRKQYYEPFKFLTFMLALSVFVNEYFHILENIPGGKTPASDFAYRHYNLLILINVPLTAFYTWLLFRRRGYHFAELLAAQAFLGGYRTLFFVLILAPLLYFQPEHGVMALFLYVIAWMGYFTWANLQLLGKPLLATILKTIAVTLLTQMTITLGLSMLLLVQK
jgi:hypothetical protein